MNRYFTALFCLLILSCQTRKPFTLEGNTVVIEEDGGQYLLSAISDQVIRVMYRDSVVNGEQVYAPLGATPVPIEIEEQENQITVATAAVRVEVQLNPVTFSFFDGDGEMKLSEEAGYFSRADTSGFRFKLDLEEAIYGTGSRAIPMNRRGQRFMNYNRPQYGYGYGGTEINFNIPHLYSSKQYMLLIDNPAKAWFDIGATDGEVLEFASLAGNMSYYFINGDSFKSLIDEYTQLTGKQPLPPLWVMGNLHSRFGYRSQQQAMSILNRSLDAGYPIDAAIFDIYWFGPELEDGQMGRLDWDLDNWPDPKGMMEAIHEKDIKTITVSEPFFTLKSGNFESLAEQGLLATNADGTAATIPDFYFGEAGLLDIFKPEAKDWIWDRYRYMKSFGVDGWWVDLGEPEKHPSYMNHVNGAADQVHGIYGHEWARMLFEGYQRDYPNERLLHLGRAGFAGSQRFGLIPWSGDISRSWSGLKAQLPIMLGMGISGIGYMHADAGGFSMIDKGDNELYTRWMQFAAFTPIFRPHADEVVPSEPVFWPRSVQNNVKPFVQLRYDLLPYNYTLAWKNKITGMPMARPMFVAYPDLPDSLETQYMWGEDFLVAPVLEPGLKTREVYLPEGLWYQFWTNQLLAGNSRHTNQLRMSDIPVYIRAGAILPKTEGIERTSAYSNAPLSLTYYEGLLPSSTVVYFDDGHTPGAYEKGAYQLLQITVSPGDEGLTLELNMEGDGYAGAPAEREVTFTIISESKSFREPGTRDVTLVTDQSIGFTLEREKVIELKYQ